MLPEHSIEGEDVPVSGSIRRVLVVDDSRLQRRILVASLKKWGFDVVEAEGGEEAMDICRADPPDLILSDWMVPGMNGIDFCRAFRAESHEAYSYFILLTSFSSPRRARKMRSQKGLMLAPTIF